MENIFIDLGISTVLSLLKSAIKNVDTKAKYEKVMKKIYDAIGNAYPEFVK